METRSKVFCWHHSDENRLRYYFSQQMVDCPSSYFLTKHGLKLRDQIRFSVKIRNQARGKVLAVAELDSLAPFELQCPRHKSYPFAAKLKNIVILSGTELCLQYPYAKPPPMNPSHWVQASPEAVSRCCQVNNSRFCSTSLRLTRIHKVKFQELVKLSPLSEGEY